MIRLMKTAMVLSVALLCLFYALNNVANLGAMQGVIGYVVSNQDHQAYSNSFGPGITSPILVWIAMGLVLIGEFSAGFLALFGSWKMFAARGKSADEFNAAKDIAILACGVGLLVWFGFFMSIGGAYFQMWQTEIGAGSQGDSFRFAAMLGIILLIVNSKDD